MYIRQLESFIVAARLLNFGEAARNLNYSQSTISEQIHSLEEYLGVQLFERMGRKVFLTENGKKLVPFAEQMVRDAKELKNMFHSNEALSGSIMVGAAETLCAFWLPPLLKEYRILHPKVQINIKVGNCVDFPQWLQQNVIDVAFGLNDESGQRQLRQKTLFRGDTVFIASPEHKLSVLPIIALQHFNGEANTMLEFGSLESIKQCVKNDPGISLLPEIAVAEELKRGELVRLNWNGPDIPIQAQMLFHQDKWLSPPLAALENLIMTRIERERTELIRML